MGAGQTEVSRIGINKGEGFRILNVHEKSPLYNKVQIFFDFIVDVIPSQESQKTPKQILNKLTEDSTVQQKNSKIKTLNQILLANVNKVVTLKLVSTKQRTAYTIEITPQINKQMVGEEFDNPILMTKLRKQRYDEAFDTYFPFSEIKLNSPIKKSGIVEKQYLIGCLEFKYSSINQMLENMYDRYFDKEVLDKNVRLAVYDIVRDETRMVEVLLARGWGSKGILGCQFLEGQLNRFPRNFAESREKILDQRKTVEKQSKIKLELSESSGTSHNLVENLKVQRNRRRKNLSNIKKILTIPPQITMTNNNNNAQQQTASNHLPTIIQQTNPAVRNSGNIPQNTQTNLNEQQQLRFRKLQERIKLLEATITNVKNYIIENQEDDEYDNQL